MQNFEKATPIKYGFLKKFEVWFLNDPVLIYTMGKVGSSTIANSLRAIGRSEVQPHSLRYSVLGSYFVVPEKCYAQKASEYFKSILLRLKTSAYLFKYRAGFKRLKVVSLVREPVSRNISAFFEQFCHLSSRPISEYKVDELIEMFWAYGRHDTPIVWFDDEINKVLGLNVFSAPFDKVLGCGYVSNSFSDCMVLKMESLMSLESELNSFLGLNGMSLSSTNRSEMKEYSALYSDFKNKICFDRVYLDKYYKDISVTHFYTADEIEGFYSRWNVID